MYFFNNKEQKIKIRGSNSLPKNNVGPITTKFEKIANNLLTEI